MPMKMMVAIAATNIAIQTNRHVLFSRLCLSFNHCLVLSELSPCLGGPGLAVLVTHSGGEGGITGIPPPSTSSPPTRIDTTGGRFSSPITSGGGGGGGTDEVGGGAKVAIGDGLAAGGDGDLGGAAIAY